MSLSNDPVPLTTRGGRHAPGIARTGSPLAALSLLALGLLPAPRACAQTASPPPVTVVRDNGSLADGFLFIGPQAVSASAHVQGPEIVDSKGRLVWFLPTPGNMAADFRVQTYQGIPVITWSQGITFGVTGPSDATDYIADSTYKVIATVRAGNGYNTDIHEFRLTPQNTALITIFNNRQADLSSVGGPVNGTVTEGVVQEIDVATGKVLLEWHSLDNVPLTESYRPVSLYQGIPYDYFHLNSVNPDTDGNLLISSRFMCTVYKINRTTGAIIWRLGGKKSDFTLGPGLPFAFQHNAIAVDASTIRIFDNESDGSVMLPQSRVIWVNHDDTNMTASIVRSIVHPEAISVAAEGGAQALDNGDTFIDWGIVGRVSEFNAAGQLVFDMKEAPGYGSYRAYRSQWVGAPATSPTAAALQNADGTLAVHAVWNGATEVATWQVLGGDTPAALSLIATAPWNGLDTPVTVPGPVNNIQVAAVNSAGAVIGTSATISGPFPAVFPTQPASQTIAAGGTAIFSAVATGSTQAYQWLFNGSPLSNGAAGGATIAGAAGPTLSISSATAANAGAYSCVASSLGNSVTSSAATLGVSAGAGAGRLVDISCRCNVVTGGGALIIGFVLGGQGASGSEPLLLRASGPALAQFGVAGALSDPSLALYGAAGAIAADSGWAGNPQVASTAAQVGAFRWSSPSSLDSALATALAPGTYTAVISGASADKGIALGEVYDAAPAGTRLPDAPRLVNVSGRAQVGTGANALIAGFVVGGSTSETVLIRGSGPALAQYGVTDALADPLLNLYRSNSDGTATLLGSNAGWNGDPIVAVAAASVGAFSWGSSASADSALLVTLPPGAYTAEISGAAGDTGVSLVEIYEVP